MMERAGFYKTLHGTPPPCDKPRCVVCGDEASGIHYGVNSCEGCKGFFRRCMVKGMSQKCTNNEECEITRFARNSCQFCRLKKCIRMGMSRSASKVGRRPKTTGLSTDAAATVTSEPKSGVVKKNAAQKFPTHRRSHSLISPTTPVNNGGEQDNDQERESSSIVQRANALRYCSSLQNSPQPTRRESLVGTSERTSGSFTPPYPTPSSSRASSNGTADMDTSRLVDFATGPVVDSHGYINYKGSDSRVVTPAFDLGSYAPDVLESRFYGMQHRPNSSWGLDSATTYQAYDLSNGRNGNIVDPRSSYSDERIRSQYPEDSPQFPGVEEQSPNWEPHYMNTSQNGFFFNRRN